MGQTEASLKAESVLIKKMMILQKNLADTFKKSSMILTI